MIYRRGPRDLTWRTALSCNGGACIQVAADDRAVLIANSRKRRGPVLSYTYDEWRAFVAGVKQGDFDDLLK